MTDEQSNARLFAEAGRALYGELWQSAMARRLNINQRTVQYIASAASRGEPYRIAPGIMAELVDILREQSTVCKDLSRKIAAFTGS